MTGVHGGNMPAMSLNSTLSMQWDLKMYDYFNHYLGLCPKLLLG